jgi:hypothetical protein
VINIYIYIYIYIYMYPFNELCFDGFGVYTVAVIQVVVFWIVMPYSTTSLHGITTQENST